MTSSHKWDSKWSCMTAEVDVIPILNIEKASFVSRKIVYWCKSYDLHIREKGCTEFLTISNNSQLRACICIF